MKQVMRLEKIINPEPKRIYVFDDKGKKRGLFVLTIKEEGADRRVNMGFSFCCKNDDFSRSLANTIALRRLECGKYSFLLRNNGSFTSRHDIKDMLHTLLARAFEEKVLPWCLQAKLNR